MERTLLEREDEIRVLGERLDAVARTGAGAVVLVAGEAGVGKTTLVRRFCDGRPRTRALWGACDPLATPAPLGPVLDVAAQLGGAAARLLAQAAKPYEAARALLDDLASERGAVVVLEDLHWADEGTLDVLTYLARRIERAPALVVCTYRDDDLEPSHRLRTTLGLLATAARVERLRPAPLSRTAVRALAEAAGRDADAVFAATSGNPFFVTELLAAPAGAVPSSVRDAVLARAAPLDADARAVLDLVAVTPPEAELWLLDAAAESGLDALERCVDAGMLERRGHAVRFRHELARLALAHELGPARAARLHARVLRALEHAGAEPSRLVHHAEAAGDAAALLRHAVVAGDRAAALGAHREAAAHYARAVAAAASRPDDERADLLARYAYECYLTDRLDDAVRAQQESVALVRSGDGLRRLSRFLWFGGRNADAEAAARDAVAVLEQHEPGPELARAYSNLSQLRMLAYDTDAAIAWGERALELAQRVGADDIAVHALSNIGSAELRVGREQGRAKLEASLAQARALALDDDAGRAYANLISNAVQSRDYVTADRYLAEGIAYCDEHDLISYGLYLRAWRARRALEAGRWEAADDAVGEVLAHPQVSAPTRIVANVVAGLLAVRRGDAAAGEALLDEALAVASATRELQRLAPVAAARAEAAWLRDDAAGLDAATADAAALAAELEEPWALGELAAWRRRAGLPVPAGEVAPPFAAELAGDVERAAMLWTDLGCPYAAALALADADDEAALRRAHAELQRLGATRSARVVAARLRARGARDIPRGPYRRARANPAGLTARELEVLTLLAEPLRNTEIAQRLVLSPRTVDHHVSAILAKLGARTRAEAVAEAQRLGLAERP